MSYSEPIKISGNTYYFKSATNVGLYVSGKDAILIDSGNDSEAGRQLLKAITAMGLTLKLIINTHSNADHVGGNNFLQEKTNCKIASTNIESAFIENPILETSFLYGGFPFEKNINKFLCAKESRVTDIIKEEGKILDTNLEAFPLPGHFFGMIGVKTPDNVFFAADSIFSENIMNKYHMFFIYDVKRFFETLNYLETIKNSIIIPSHAEITNDLSSLIVKNKEKINEIIASILEISKTPKTFESILSEISKKYSIKIDENQYILIGSTLRSYLTYLNKLGKISYSFDEGQLYWYSV